MPITPTTLLFIFNLFIATTMASVITESLVAKLKDGGKATAIVTMLRGTQEALDKVEAQKPKNRDERATAVTRELQALAEDSQKHLKQFLDSQSPPVKYESMWISNTMVIREATLDLLQKLEALGGIKEIREEHTAHIMGVH